MIPVKKFFRISGDGLCCSLFKNPLFDVGDIEEFDRSCTRVDTSIFLPLKGAHLQNQETVVILFDGNLNNLPFKFEQTFPLFRRPDKVLIDSAVNQHFNSSAKPDALAFAWLKYSNQI